MVYALSFAGPSSHEQIKQINMYVVHDDWQKAERIYRKMPHLKTVPITSRGDTALHLAVTLNRTSFFNGLVGFNGLEGLMTPQELEIKNKDDNTAFWMSVTSGNVEFAQTMLLKNPRLAMIGRSEQRWLRLFPIHVAAARGHRQMLQLLCPATILDDMPLKLITRLFFSTLENNIFGKTTHLPLSSLKQFLIFPLLFFFFSRYIN